MAAERKSSSSITPVGELPFTRHVEGRGDFTPVGVIFYNGGEQMILLAEEFGGNLHAKIAESQGLRKDNLLETGRALDLSHCSEVTVMQFKYGSEIRVGLSETIERHAPTSIRFSCSPITTIEETPSSVEETKQQVISEIEAKKVFNAPEKNVLEAMAGWRGGIAVFKDTDLPVANAFVIERKRGDQVSSYVLLFAASEMHGGYEIKSTEALENFLQRINLAFEQQSRLPIQTAALESYEAQQISFTQSVREAAYRGQIIANARLYTHTKQPRYKRFLDEHVPDTRRNLIARFTATLKRRTQEDREKSVDRIIIDDEGKREEAIEPEREKGVIERPKALPETRQRTPAICERLNTDWAKDLRIGYDSHFGINDGSTKAYLQAIYSRVMYGQASLDDLDDMTKQLSELLGSDFASADLGDYATSPYILDDFVGIKFRVSLMGYYYCVHGGQLIGKIMNAIDQKRARLVY